MPVLPFSAMPKVFEYKAMTHPELYRRNVEFFLALIQRDRQIVSLRFADTELNSTISFSVSVHPFCKHVDSSINILGLGPYHDSCLRFPP
jgi:hypothetical protein